MSIEKADKDTLLIEWWQQEAETQQLIETVKAYLQLTSYKVVSSLVVSHNANIRHRYHREVPR